MMKRNSKKGISLVLAGILCLGLLGGCQKEEKETIQEAVGSYVEQEMEAPWQEEEDYIGSFLNQEEQMEIYVVARTEKGKAEAFSYVQTGESDWEKREQPWASALWENEAYVPYSLIQGEDKNLYLMIYEATEEAGTEAESEEVELVPIPWHLYRYTPGQEAAEEIFPECLSIEKQKVTGTFMPNYIGAAENGDLVLTGSVKRNDIVLYDKDTGKEKASFENHFTYTNRDGMITVSGNTLLTLGKDEKELIFYDLSSGKEMGSVDCEDAERGYLYGLGDSYYLADNRGISVYQENGSIREQIYDGNQGLMGGIGNNLDILNFLAGEEKDFYAIYRDYQEGTNHLCYYAYQAGAGTEVEKTLTIYGLYQSSMIEDSVRAFRKAHPEVEVDYQYAIKQEESANPEDFIDTLNTELLNQKGADVLLLDDLPIASYVEKGILEDLSSLTQEMTKDGTLLEKIAKGMEIQGKSYGIPASFRLPVWYGTEESLAHVESLEDIQVYLNENAEGELIEPAAYEQLAYLLFSMAYEELLEENGSFSQEKITQVFELAKQLGDNQDASKRDMMEESWQEYFKTRIVSGNQMDAFSGIGMKELYNRSDLAGVDSLNGLGSTAIILDILKQNSNMTIKGIQEYYLPQNILGINRFSEEKELAQEFLETTLSGEVQERDYQEGFPIRTESLEKQAEISEKNEHMTFASSYGDGEVHEYSYPTKAQVEQIIALAKEVSKPLMLDLTVRKTFLDCAEQYFGGSSSAEEAAKTMCEKMELYLSE